MENQTSDIGARLEKLERENRKMKKAGIVVAVFGAALIAMGQSQSQAAKVVEAHEFRLKDSSGAVRGKLFTNDEGQTLLELQNAVGTATASIGTGSVGASINLSGSDSKSSLTLMSGPASMFPTINLRGSAGNVTISADKDFGGPSIWVEDVDGYEAVIGKSNLENTKTGKKESTPAASVVLFDKQKKVLWSVP